MRILAISNLYPPLHLGGYEIGCADVVEGLRGRGHDVSVLTSSYGIPAPRVDGDVYRRLGFRQDRAGESLPELLRYTRRDQKALARVLAMSRPELVLVFSLYGVSHALLLAAQRTGYPIVYAFSAEWLAPGYQGDPWLGRWSREAAPRARRVLKRAVRRVANLVVPTGLEPLDLRRAFFTSDRLRRLFLAKGFPVEQATVIHWGVDVARFHPPTRVDAGGSARALFAGRIATEKGLHTAVEALGLLRSASPHTDVTLDVAGPVQDPAYLDAVRRDAERAGLLGRVRFLGPVPRDAMPHLYREHDIYLLPSIWEEPFSIGLVEAMASGLAVAGTPTGGSAEILRDGENGLVFSPGDARGLADCLRRLQAPETRSRLGRAARETVEISYRFENMLTQIEAFLLESLRTWRE